MKSMKSKRTARRSASGRLSLGTYMACAATVGVYGLASSAEASIVVLNLASVGSPSKNITGLNGGTAAGGKTDVDNFPSATGTPDMDVYNMFVDSYSNETYHGVDGDSGLAFAVTGSSNASPRAFSAGESIDDASQGIQWSYRSNETVFYHKDIGGTAFSSPNFGANKYLAFRVMQSAGSGNYQFGWIEATWNSTTKQYQLLSAAYETSFNTAIAAGSTGGSGGTVPEPSSGVAVAMLMGGTALRQWRKNRREAATNANDNLAS